MRMSDWSSDVCSSDLFPRSGNAPPVMRTDGGCLQAAPPDEWSLSSAACLYAADRHSVWHAECSPGAYAGPCRPQVRSRLRPLHDAPEPSVQLAEAFRYAGDPKGGV